jgi:hypothetical protein
MKRFLKGLLVSAAVFGVMAAPAFRAEAQQAKGPSVHMVAIYQVAAGKHLDFLKWMAAREAIAKEAGGPASMWYAHRDGGSWDYISITPQLDGPKQDEVDKKVDALSKQKGLSIGFKASLEFRQFMATHSDTYAFGPMTAGDMVKEAEKKD